MKASLVTWGKQLALFHGKDGIRVNVVSPGPVEFEGGNWDMIKGTMEKFYQSQLRQQPTGRLDTPAEIARCIAFLASPAASWRSEEPTSDLQSLLRSSYAVLCLKKNKSTT